jgi:hypothetical protein
VGDRDNPGDGEVQEMGLNSIVIKATNDDTAFRNRSDCDVRFLNFNAPGGWENYVRDLAAASKEGRNPSAEEIGEIASRYDFRAV